jgi:benzoyl-CoA reductase subunit C
MERLTGSAADDADLRRSIRAHNENRRLVRELERLRADAPWRAPASECYLVLRAAMVLPVEAHGALLDEYLSAARAADRRERDDARVLIAGAFCEQPPLGLIRTLERAGCALVGDDFMPVLSWARTDVAETGDPIEALSAALTRAGAAGASRYVADERSKGDELVAAVRAARAEGVIFAAPSFCDPALLDRPMLQRALDEAGIAHTSFQYAENSGQMQPIREQAGTFADAIKLWSEPAPAEALP